MPTKPPAPAVPADKPPRKAVDKLPVKPRVVGPVRVRLPTFVLSDEDAEAWTLATQHMIPSDRSALCAAARGAVVLAAQEAIQQRTAVVVAELRKHRHAAAKEAARLKAEQAAAEYQALVSAEHVAEFTGSQASPLAEQPTGEVSRKSATGA